MAIRQQEIRPGVVAYLDVTLLNNDNSVQKPPSPAPRNGPFLCYATQGQLCAWIEISTQSKENRLLIDKRWRKSGAGAWLTEDQYLNDGLTIYSGPKASFSAASQATDFFAAATRPRVSTEGLAWVVHEIQKRGGPSTIGVRA